MMAGAHGRRRAFTWLAIVIVLLTAAVVHTDFDSTPRPTCPACQLERHVVCLSLTDYIATNLPEPAALSLPVEVQQPETAGQNWYRIPPTRSPPV